jgi:phosphatidylglycerophosphatase A
VRDAGNSNALERRGRSVKALSRKAVLFFVTGAGAGYFPRFPGTIGTLVAIPFSIVLNRIASKHFIVALLIIIAAIVLAIWLSTKGAGILKQKDPQVIVIDEIVGFWVTNFLAPLRWSVLLVGFLLFRFFDIAKIFPINRLEQIPGGAGIVLDDVVAGVYAFIILQLLLRLNWL